MFYYADRLHSCSFWNEVLPRATLPLQFYSFYPPTPPHCPQTVCAFWPHETLKQKKNQTESLNDERERWTSHSRVWSPIATSSPSLRAELVSATYSVHRNGYHDTKYYKTSCSCTKTNIFVEILHFKQQLIQSENCRLQVMTYMNKDFDSTLLVEALNIIGMAESSLQWQNFGTRKALQKKTMSIWQGQHRWVQTKYHFYTSVHSKPFGTDYRSLCLCDISVCSNHLKEIQATEGRGRWVHTQMEVRQKGIDINRKTTSGVTVTIEFSFLHRC